MGMFDNIEYRGRPYQTKDTPAQMLDNYKIEQDQDSGHWYLWHEEYDADGYGDTAVIEENVLPHDNEPIRPHSSWPFPTTGKL